MEKTIFIVAVVAVGVMGLSMTACDISDVIWGSGGKTVFERVVIQSGEPKKSSSTQNATNPSPSNTNSSSSNTASSVPVAPVNKPAAPVNTNDPRFLGHWQFVQNSPIGNTLIDILIRNDGKIVLSGIMPSVNGTYPWTSSGNRLTAVGSKWNGTTVIIDVDGSGNLCFPNFQPAIKFRKVP